MKRILLMTLAVALLASPAVHATTMTFTSEGTFDFDGYGNALTHTEDGVTVKLTGWSTSNGTTVFNASRVRRFSTGLGTCASSETGSNCNNPQHAVDNNGRKEILLLTFSTPVLVTEALISAWADDFDATFWGGTGSINMTATSFAALDTLAAGPTADKGHDEFTGNAFDGQLRTIPLGAIASPVSWLVFGAQPNESNDHFKFKSLTFIVPQRDTPEPGVLLLLGIGTALLAARARKRNAD